MPETLIPEDLSEKQLKLGYWFVAHKVLLRRILETILIVASAAMLGYSGYGLVKDYLDAPARQQMMADLAKNLLNPLVHNAQTAKPLAVSNSQVLVSGGKYDFIGQVSNPNKDFIVHYSYRFVAGSFATAPKLGFILPVERKFIAELGVAAASRPSGAALEINDVAWERVNKHEIPDWASYASEHLNMPVKDIAYTPGIEIAAGKPKIGRTSFTLTNDTGYGYYGLRILVLMYRGPALVAVNATALPTIGPGESKPGEVTWYEDYGAITQIKVIPEIDITDQSVYIRTGG